MFSQKAYFDHAASTPVLEESLVAIEHSFREDFANPHAAHRFGKGIADKIERCRADVIATLGRGSFVFTSGATEANNQLIKELRYKISHIYCHLGDHPSLVAPAKFRAQRDGIPLRPIPLLKSGRIDWPSFFADLKDAAQPLIVLSLLHNQTGIYFDLKEKTEELKKFSPNSFIHIDAVQGYGKIDLREKVDYTDSLTVSAHKIGGPKGIGGLWVFDLESLHPMLLGGGQEFGKRSSTLAAPLILGMHQAVKFWEKKREDEFGRISRLSSKIVQELSNSKLKISFPFVGGDSSPYILGTLVDGVSSDITLRMLEEEGVIVSSSAACSSRAKTESPALKILGWDLKKQKSFLRISMGPATTNRDVERLISAFNKIDSRWPVS